MELIVMVLTSVPDDYDTHGRVSIGGHPGDHTIFTLV